MITGAKLALLYGVMGLMACSFALGDEPQGSASHPPHSSAQIPEPQSPAAPTPNEAETASEAAHVPPDPPQHPMGDMPYHEMAAIMQMDDTARTSKVLFDQLEWRNTAEGNAAVWDAEGWYGGDYNKVWLRSQDFGAGPGRTWAAVGVQGLAPYWFDTEATFYVGEQGRTAVRLKTEYELLFTQRLILQPEAEANLYGKADPARQLGSGLSDLEIGLRLRYEVHREFAPYVGVVWSRSFGGTADRVRESGGDASDVQFVAGLRAWF
jgi:copper resistance protein B